MRLLSRAAALLYFFIVGLHAQWISEVDDRIKQFNVSGDPAVEGEFPYMAILKLNDDLCEGTLVGPSHILTAAQCLFGRSTTDATNFQVLLNTLTTDGDAGVVTVGVTNFIIHENFNPVTNDNDVALLVLESSVTDVPPIPSESMSDLVHFDHLFNGKITNRASSTYADSPAVIIGWGTTITPGGSLSNTLLKADVVVEDNTICASQYPDFVGDNMLCATFTEPGIDIGGPLFVDGVQVGINSFGYNVDCADPSYTGLYTRVTTYLEWIATTMANNP
ncbi:trypsin Blo t 3-like [Daphnia pulicaria]|uniref:trypsin Blo t 3-like n=1 Tax=Daphnia pulicaria TaxID=35523 RepID=UPI001EEC6A29|nr:trypsin Blo t 3-like [Daphnia pulicaria]